MVKNENTFINPSIWSQELAKIKKYFSCTKISVSITIFILH